MRRRRLIIALVVLLALAGVTAITWRLADWPPPGMILRYGLTPGCEPTGETMTLEGIEFVEIGPGCFRMGSIHLAEGGDFLGEICASLGLPWGDQPALSNEMPVHWVEFRHGFWIARTEVTNSQYSRFDPDFKRSAFSPCDDQPVTNVSWHQAKAHCRWLATKSGWAVRLPSESEWEAAARGGASTEYSFGSEDTELPTFAWHDVNSSDGCPHPVAALAPNRWGLYDFHGNAWEWCEDTYNSSYLGAPTDGSAWSGEVESLPMRKAIRGGGWFSTPEHVRSSFRLSDDPNCRRGGIRLALSAGGD